MARQHTNIRTDSVPSFLHGHLDRRRARRSHVVDPARKEYISARQAGCVPIRLAQQYMNLVHHGMGTYTDDLGMPWYRDGETIVRVTDNLDWIEKKASQEDLPKGAKRVAQDTQTENAEDMSNVPSTSGDYELPQERGYNTEPPRRRRRRKRLIRREPPTGG